MYKNKQEEIERYYLQNICLLYLRQQVPLDASLEDFFLPFLIFPSFSLHVRGFPKGKENL
jgi:hypothetical protein